MADGIDGVLPHLHARDLTVLFVSRAPLPKLQAYKQRMGWSIPWVSSGNNDFSFDLGASVPDDEVRRTMPPEDEVSPVAQQFARASGTNVHAYLAEVPTAGAFVLALLCAVQFMVVLDVGYLAVAGTAVIWANVGAATVNRVGVKPTPVFGMAMLTVGLVLFTQVSVGGSYWADLFPGFAVE